MKFVKFIENDIVDSDDGVAVSVWFGGCPHKCKGCHNAQLWDENCVEETPLDLVIKELIPLINKNGVMRNLSILGGEPLAPYNRKDVSILINKIKKVYPNIKIYLWTGYTIEDLRAEINDDIKYVLSMVDVLIDGPFILEQRDITLKLRGSSNQRIFRRENGSLQIS